MAFDYEQALKDGNSQEEILRFLGERTKFDYARALKDGVPPLDIIQFLSDKAEPEKQPEVQPLSPQQALPPQQGGFISDIKSAFAKREEEHLRAKERQAAGIQTPLETGFQLVGGATGFVQEAEFAGLKAGVKALLPKFIEDQISAGGKKLLNTRLGQFALTNLSQGIGKYEAWKKSNPENERFAENLESAINLGSLYLELKSAARAIPAVQQKVENVGEFIGEHLQKREAERALAEVDQAIDKGLMKGIKPSLAGIKTLPQSQKFKEEGRLAVKTIVQNKPALRFVDEATHLETEKLPETVAEFQDAIHQTKKIIFADYDELAREGQVAKVQINLNKLVGELEKVEANDVVRDNAPDIAEYAGKRASALSSRVSYGARQTQDAIELYNQSLSAFYKNPTYQESKKAVIDAMIANNLRKGLDESIEKTVGEGYQKLKNQYGALNSIEEAVTKRAFAEAKKNAKGLIDFSDIFSAGQVAHGILSMNPGFIASGLAQKAIAILYKLKNSPDAIIKGMFKTVDKALSGAAKFGMPPF